MVLLSGTVRKLPRFHKWSAAEFPSSQAAWVQRFYGAKDRRRHRPVQAPRVTDYPALGYSGYGDGKSTHIADFVNHEMRLD
jgi:hypothetical protein